ncbi:MAG: DUF998 domain-containing protein [Rubrobacter sp.]|nr:DUF998 domain-containing protein [Rubrobacter sp.]
MEGGTEHESALYCGAIVSPLFVATFLVEGDARVGYEPLRHPVSSLGLGDHGWVQTANFVVASFLTLAFAERLRLALWPGKGAIWGPLLIGTWAIGLLGAAIFSTDPVSGYPPGTPDQLARVHLARRPTRSLHAPRLRGAGGRLLPALCSAASSPPGASAGGRSTRSSPAWRSRLHSYSPAQASDRPKASWSSPGCSSASWSRSASAG